MFYNITYRICILLISSCATVVADCEGGGDNKNNTNSNLPATFPCQWTDGIIPYAFDFFSINSNRLLSTIRKGHELIQNQSCLIFNERNPITMAASPKSYYYLYYIYSNSLENCCAAPERGLGQRMVLITPGCKEPHEVAHVTLHMLGLWHSPRAMFSMPEVTAIFKLENCHERMKRNGQNVL